jgi:hypothetical protein
VPCSDPGQLAWPVKQIGGLVRLPSAKRPAGQITGVKAKSKEACPFDLRGCPRVHAAGASPSPYVPRAARTRMPAHPGYAGASGCAGESILDASGAKDSRPLRRLQGHADSARRSPAGHTRAG